MLKKLIQHEWRETWKIPALVLTVSVILSVICAIYFYFTPAPTPDVEVNVGKMSFFILYAFAIAITSLLITIYLGIRFYKNLYTDEGYLMHTLPVRPWALVLSKTLISSLWIYLAGILALVTVFPVTFLALPKMAYIEPADLDELIRMMTSTLFGGRQLQMLFFFIPYSFASAVSSILLVYAAISLGQLLGRHKVLSSIVCYLGLNALLSTLSSIFLVPGITGVVITHADDTENFYELVMPSLMKTTYISSFFVSLLLTAVCFFLCNYLLQKCLNLD
ncbi:MAG: hypothetical protein Q4C58_00395 [Eubacteriales bacterium]|nr:hypothetical protein [Eubacteriales bacterium]